MKKNSFLSRPDLVQIIGVVISVGIFIGLILLAVYYTPDEQFQNDFFEDVSNAVQWK